VSPVDVQFEHHGIAMLDASHARAAPIEHPEMPYCDRIRCESQARATVRPPRGFSVLRRQRQHMDPMPQRLDDPLCFPEQGFDAGTHERGSHVLRL